MRLISKYKHLDTCKGSLKLPLRVLNFKRTKWLFLKRAILKILKFRSRKRRGRRKFQSRKFQNKLLLNRYLTFVRTGKWDKKKKSFKNKVIQNRYLLLRLHNNKRRRKKFLLEHYVNKEKKLRALYFKTFFEINYFLHLTCIAKTSYEATKFIESRSIYKNFTSSLDSIQLSSGDILSLKSKKYSFKALKKRYDLPKSLPFFYEYDYYTQSFVILKNFNEINQKDMFLLNSIM